METNKKHLGKFNTRRCSITLLKDHTLAPSTTGCPKKSTPVWFLIISKRVKQLDSNTFIKHRKGYNLDFDLLDVRLRSLFTEIDRVLKIPQNRLRSNTFS